MRFSRYFLFLLMILFSIPKSFCQGWIDPKDITLRTERKFTDDKIKQLKNTTTVFFYPGCIRPHLDSLKRVVAECWNLTRVIFDDISNVSNYMDTKYSFFVIDALDESGRDNTTFHYFMTLTLITDISKRGKIKTMAFCRDDLYPDNSTLEKKPKYGWGKVAKTMDEIYEEAIFYNFSPVLIKAQLERVAGIIKNGVRPKVTEFIKANNLSQLLSNDTLYVPAALLPGYDPNKKNNDNVFENYPHHYRICTDDELYNIFEKEQRGRLLFEYVRSAIGDKIITIYDLKDKKPVYRQQSYMNGNLKTKDIERFLD